MVVVVMGVAGAGKTTVGRVLARRLGVPYGEADEFHSADNVAKMAAGVPLTDEDRAPWLAALAEWVAGHPDGGVVGCSALKYRYRQVLGEVWFLHLVGDRSLIADRLAARTGHFLAPSLLDSQFADLEPLLPTERGIVLHAALAVDEIVDRAVDALSGHRRGEAR